MYLFTEKGPCLNKKLLNKLRPISEAFMAQQAGFSKDLERANKWPPTLDWHAKELQFVFLTPELHKRHHENYVHVSPHPVFWQNLNNIRMNSFQQQSMRTEKKKQQQKQSGHWLSTFPGLLPADGIETQSGQGCKRCTTLTYITRIQTSCGRRHFSHWALDWADTKISTATASLSRGEYSRCLHIKV